MSRRPQRILLAFLLALAALGVGLIGTQPASAHVLPTSTVRLTVGAGSIEADVSIPASDLEAASGIDLGDATPAAVAARTDAIRTYLVTHIRPTSDSGQAWRVDVAAPTSAAAGDVRTTGLYRQVEAVLTLTPPTGADLRSFNLGYTAVVDRVATHSVIVTVASDWSGGRVQAAAVGTVARDTVTDTVVPLHVDLGTGNNLRGFLSMVRLGVLHIQEGTDHQLFLLTLLLPAPLLAGGRRWRGPVGGRRAFRRIATITMAFTLGHSTTLALGALGVPVPQQSVEALIAVSILIAAVHAIRPIFPGKEAIVAGCFGLVHGLAFSETLRDLDLSGPRLVLSLLGFNLGIELMQLTVVALVLPPLVVLSRRPGFRLLRVGAAGLTGIAAVGWATARLGRPNLLADLADSLGSFSVPAVACLWGCALVSAFRGRAQLDRPHSPVRVSGPDEEWPRVTRRAHDPGSRSRRSPVG